MTDSINLICNLLSVISKERRKNALIIKDECLGGNINKE